MASWDQGISEAEARGAPGGLHQEGGSDHAQGTETTRKKGHGLGVTAQAWADGALPRCPFNGYTGSKHELVDWATPLKNISQLG